MSTPASGPEQDPQKESGPHEAPGSSGGGEPRPDDQRRAAPSVAESMTAYAQRSGMRRTDAGQLDVLHAVGGWRGLAEAILPGAVFLVVFVLSQGLGIALISALAVAGVFTIARLAQRQTLVQAMAGLIGVLVCAFFAWRSGDAIEYYVAGLWINLVYLIAMGASIAAGWPLLGVLFGFIRGEGMDWRRDPRRMRGYRLATGLVAGMFAARLLVQVPLYLTENVAGLGIARLAMGVPLYAAVLWLGWLISRPAAVDPAAPEDELRRSAREDSGDDSV